MIDAIELLNKLEARMILTMNTIDDRDIAKLYALFISDVGFVRNNCVHQHLVAMDRLIKEAAPEGANPTLVSEHIHPSQQSPDPPSLRLVSDEGDTDENHT